MVEVIPLLKFIKYGSMLKSFKTRDWAQNIIHFVIYHNYGGMSCYFVVSSDSENNNLEQRR